MTPTKVCPVVVRRGPAGDQLLVFRHPEAGVQLVKGTIERGEDLAAAARRELAEESGIRDACVIRNLGTWDAGYERQVWAFVEMNVGDVLPQEWTHRTNDAGGLEFSFFWHPFSRRPSNEWHRVYADAFNYVARHLAPSGKERCASR